MSKKKTPPEKKASALSAAGGMCTARIPQQAAKTSRWESSDRTNLKRHAVDQTLNALVGEPDEDQMIAIEGKAKTQGRLEELRSFKMTPDAPLGEVIKQKRRWRGEGEDGTSG